VPPPEHTAQLSRWLGVTGLGFALSGAAIWLIAPIDMPQTADAVSRHYGENRTMLIVTSIVVVSGSALVAAWYVALATLGRSSALGRTLGQVGVVGMAIQIGALSAAFTVIAAVAYREPAPATAQTLTDVAWLLINLAGGPVTTVAIIAFAIALGQAGFGGRWLMPLSVLAALAHLVVAASFARSGFFSPEGGVEIVVPVIYQAWIAAVAVALLTGARHVATACHHSSP
jgi:hypothetical protein